MLIGDTKREFLVGCFIGMVREGSSEEGVSGQSPEWQEGLNHGFEQRVQSLGK